MRRCAVIGIGVLAITMIGVVLVTVLFPVGPDGPPLTATVLQGKWISHPAGPCACFHPDTDPEYMEAFLKELARRMGKYERNDRWVTTASGGTGSLGDPITLTYSFVPDGTDIRSEEENSDLFEKFNAAFPSEETWRERFNNALNLWAKRAGISYIEDADDGASVHLSAGILGVRGDVRVAGAPIDGPLNVLAYNYYPDYGDMILDTDDADWYAGGGLAYRRFRNVAAHEHGHGLGFGHVIPQNCTKLMEPAFCASFLGLQDDDIRGAQRNHGDPLENNDILSEAYDLGTLIDTMVTLEDLCTDSGGDVDWFRFITESSHRSLSVTVDPVGSGYMIGPQGGTTVWTKTDSINNLEFEVWDETGSILLMAMDIAPIESTEVLTEFGLPDGGTYHLKVENTPPTVNDVQRYTMTVELRQYTSVAELASSERGPRGLEVSVFPNPYNPNTTIRFHTAHAGEATLDIYDALGRLTRRIIHPVSAEGWTEILWDGRNQSDQPAASGIYFMRVQAGEASETVRSVLLK